MNAVIVLSVLSNVKSNDVLIMLYNTEYTHRSILVQLLEKFLSRV